MSTREILPMSGSLMTGEGRQHWWAEAKEALSVCGARDSHPCTSHRQKNDPALDAKSATVEKSRINQAHPLAISSMQLVFVRN